MSEKIVDLWNFFLRKILYSVIIHFQETLVDVTLACEGKLFQAHKFVLAMCSDFFKEMFATNPCKHPIGKNQFISYVNTLVFFKIYDE